MATIVTRESKGEPLTTSEIDQNFINLEDSKIKRESFEIETASSITPEGTTYAVTALAGSLTINIPVTTKDGWRILLIIKDNGTSRELTWDGDYRAFSSALPEETVPNESLYVLIVYDDQDEKWDVISQSAFFSFSIG
jgi:hypothetical protein